MCLWPNGACVSGEACVFRRAESPEHVSLADSKHVSLADSKHVSLADSKHVCQAGRSRRAGVLGPGPLGGFRVRTVFPVGLPSGRRRRPGVLRRPGAPRHVSLTTRNRRSMCLSPTGACVSGGACVSRRSVSFAEACVSRRSMCLSQKHVSLAEACVSRRSQPPGPVFFGPGLSEFSPFGWGSVGLSSSDTNLYAFGGHELLRTGPVAGACVFRRSEHVSLADRSMCFRPFAIAGAGVSRLTRPPEQVSIADPSMCLSPIQAGVSRHAEWPEQVSFRRAGAGVSGEQNRRSAESGDTNFYARGASPERK